jgi:thiamine biosynthesis lipoprotein
MGLTAVKSAEKDEPKMLQFLPGRLVALLASAVLLTAGACTATPTDHQARFFVFGTVVDVTVWSVGDGAADRAFRELGALFQALHEKWHAWEPGLLTDVNRAFAEGRPARADATIVELIRRSQDLEAATGGRFNPAIGKLIDLWGFHTSDFPVMGPPPSAADIRALVDRRPSTQDIHIDGLELSSSNPAVQLDFGGIAKGYAIDLACQALRRLGLDNAIVNAGGDLETMGRHGDRPWRIAIRDPHGGIIGRLDTRGDEAIFTSGNYERYRENGTARYPHILDPRTGWPVSELSSVTVIAREGLLADAAATALTVAGPSDWPAVAGALGLDQVLVVDEEGTVYLTPAMQARVQLEDGLKVVVSEPGG